MTDLVTGTFKVLFKTFAYTFIIMFISYGIMTAYMLHIIHTYHRQLIDVATEYNYLPRKEIVSIFNGLAEDLPSEGSMMSNLSVDVWANTSGATMTTDTLVPSTETTGGGGSTFTTARYTDSQVKNLVSETDLKHIGSVVSTEGIEIPFMGVIQGDDRVILLDEDTGTLRRQCGSPVVIETDVTLTLGKTFGRLKSFLHMWGDGNVDRDYYKVGLDELTLIKLQDVTVGTKYYPDLQ